MNNFIITLTVIGIIASVFLYKRLKKRRNVKYYKYISRGDSYFNERFYITAIWNYNKANKIKKTPEVYFRIIECLIITKDLEGAREYCIKTELLLDAQKDLYTLFERGMFLARLEKHIEELANIN